MCTVLLVVIESAAKMRDDDVGGLFGRLNFVVVAGLDALKVVVDAPVEIALVFDGVLIDPAGEADVGVGVDEDAQVDEGGQVFGDFVAHEDVGAFDDEQFGRLEPDLEVLSVALVVDLDLVADDQGQGLLVEEFPVGAVRSVLVAPGGIDEVGLVEDGDGLACLADGPLLLLVLEHVVDHLLLPRAVPAADAHHEGLAVLVDEVDVDLLQLAHVDGLLVGLHRLGSGDLIAALRCSFLHVDSLYFNYSSIGFV
jgi:hypothetical protein